MQHQAVLWGLMCVLQALFTTVQYSSAVVSKGSLPWEIQDCYNRYARFSLREVVGHSVCLACEAPTISRLGAGFEPVESPEAVKYFQNLMGKLNNHMHEHRVKRQSTTRCIRKEYRMLTDQERFAFHNALETLKRDTRIWPNRYDVLARIHSGPITNTAHGGPNFFGWHRVYIRLLEMELQDIDPSVCLPYWDSSLDSELADPRTSYVFSPDFLGRFVANGPFFPGWVSERFGPLVRNIGRTGQLFSQRLINNILSQRRTRDITEPNAFPQNNIELQHNGIHAFMGGQMSSLQSAAHDPVFFLHHCFVDYLWERFRNQQRAAGIDPQRDYPPDFGSPFHAPNRQMGFPNLNTTAIQGYANYQTNTYVYEPSPTCSWFRPYCGSRYLWCNVFRARCIPIRPFTFRRRKRAVVPAHTNPGRSTVNTTTAPGRATESTSRSPTGIQNTFCIDGICDTREWVYVAVKVVSMRSPNIQTFNCHPVYNGTIWNQNDIYQPSAYAETSRYISKGHPKSYEKCNDGDGIGHIIIQSHGLNYGGFYKESVIIDQRFATSLAVGYLAVKDPKNGPVKVLFRAADSCGRICRTAFRTLGTTRYEPFSGVLDIEDVPGLPRQYSQTYGQATLDTWGYSSNPNFPSFRDDDICVTFYCDYSDELIWSDKYSSSVPHQTSMTPTSPLALGPNECRIDAECIISAPCNITLNEQFCYGRKFMCEGTCNKYVECHNGSFHKAMCPNNLSYDRWSDLCTASRLCPNTRTDTPAVSGQSARIR